MAEQGFRITYATMSADNEDLHKGYEEGIEVAKSWLGQKHPLYVNGEARWGSGTKEARSPIDGTPIGEFAQGTREDVRDAVVQAGLKRIRPSLMTISTTIFGLMPIFWATGRGSDVMKPMAIPSVGGMVVSVLVTISSRPA